MHNPKWLAVFFGIGLNCDSPVLEALLFGLCSRRGDEIWSKLIEIGFNESTLARELNQILQQCNWVRKPISSASILLESKTCPRNHIIIEFHSQYRRYVENFRADDTFVYSVILHALNDPFANLEGESAVIVQYVNGCYKQEKKLWRTVNTNRSIPRSLFYMHSLKVKVLL